MATQSKNAPAAPPERVVRAATQAELGGWETTTHAAHGGDDSSLLFIFGIGIPVLAAPVALPVGYFGLTFISAGEAVVLGWAMLVFSSVLSVLAILPAIRLCTEGVQVYKRGKLMIHLHGSGFVLERTRGRVAVATYDAAHAELLVYQNADEYKETWDEYGVLLTLPDGSVALVNDRSNPEFAKSLAQACGAETTRRVTSAEFVDLEEKCVWGVGQQ